LDAKRLEIEREANEKRKMEDNVMEKMMYQMTIDKATQYSKKTLGSLRKRTRELVSQYKQTLIYQTVSNPSLTVLSACILIGNSRD